MVNPSGFGGFDETCRNVNDIALPLLITEYGASVSYLYVVRVLCELCLVTTKKCDVYPLFSMNPGLFEISPSGPASYPLGRM